MNFKRSVSMVLAVAALSAPSVISAQALEYNYTSGVSQGFYQSTSVSTNAISDSGKIVVGSDGTIAANTSGNVTSSPLSALNLPIGEYPDSWGKETDVAIAQNTIFPNVLAPTTQMSNVRYPVQYDTGRINSAALPTPNQQSYYNNAYAAGVATKDAPMQALKADGTIAHLEIPAVGISESIYEGTSTQSMRKGLGHFAETSGWEGNVALAGHNRGSYGHLKNLKNVKVGDIMTYTTAYGTKTYRVVSVGTCKTTDTSGLVQDGSNKLTLYTCVENQPNIKRMVVAVQI